MLCATARSATRGHGRRGTLCTVALICIAIILSARVAFFRHVALPESPSCWMGFKRFLLASVAAQGSSAFAVSPLVQRQFLIRGASTAANAGSSSVAFPHLGGNADDDPLQDDYGPIVVGETSVKPTRRMQALEPRIGRCYLRRPELVAPVRLWRERQVDSTMALLREITEGAGQEKALKRDAYHLTMNVAELHDLFQDLYDTTHKVLQDNPRDIMALWAMASYHACAEDLVEEHGSTNGLLPMFEEQGETKVHGEVWWRRLGDASPGFHDALVRVRGVIRRSWRGWEPIGNLPVDEVVSSQWPGKKGIVVFGWGPVLFNSSAQLWQGLPPLMERIATAYDLAQAFPDAQIIASGGAVYSDKVEGDYIAEELVRRDAQLQGRIVVDRVARDTPGNVQFAVEWARQHATGGTLFLVGSDWQNPRFKAAVVGALETAGVSSTAVAVGAGMAYNPGESLQDRLWVEKIALWRDLPRALGLFEACDFEKEPPKQLSSAFGAGSLLGLLMPLAVHLELTSKGEH